MALSACAGARFRSEFVGQGNALVTPRGAPPLVAPDVAAPGAGGISVAAGAYDIALGFDLPRAQLVDYSVTCPGAEEHGTVGETFEAYRTRRLAELRAQTERDRQATATATGLLVGALAPRVRTESTTPAGTVTTEAHVNGAAVGDAVAQSAIQDIAELPPGDVGRGRVEATVHVVAAAPGACIVTAVADDPAVLGGFRVTRIHDLAAEARDRRTAVVHGAFEVRGRVTARLVGFGADAGARDRKLAALAEARARADAERAERERIERERQAKLDAVRIERERIEHERELRVRLERERIERERQAKLDAVRIERERIERERQAKLDAVRIERERIEHERELRVRIEIEERERIERERIVSLRTRAVTVREYFIAYLVGECHADAGRRTRIAAQQEAERLERERRLRIEIEIREQRLAAERLERERRFEAQRADQARRAALLAELEQHRIDAAFTTRTAVRGYLVMLGAHERPPRPAPLAENPGAPPFAGARWTAGHWDWTGVTWTWQAGGWSDSERFGAAGGDVRIVGGGEVAPMDTAPDPLTLPVVVPVGVPVGVSIGVSPVPPARPPVDHREGTVRDHRGEKHDDSRVRDHRGDNRDDSRVRDHRH